MPKRRVLHEAGAEYGGDAEDDEGADVHGALPRLLVDIITVTPIVALAAVWHPTSGTRSSAAARFVVAVIAATLAVAAAAAPPIRKRTTTAIHKLSRYTSVLRPAGSSCPKCRRCSVRAVASQSSTHHSSQRCYGGSVTVVLPATVRLPREMVAGCRPDTTPASNSITLTLRVPSKFEPKEIPSRIPSEGNSRPTPAPYGSLNNTLIWAARQWPAAPWRPHQPQCLCSTHTRCEARRLGRCCGAWSTCATWLRPSGPGLLKMSEVSHHAP